jgi:hypothetical protein
VSTLVEPPEALLVFGGALTARQRGEADEVRAVGTRLDGFQVRVECQGAFVVLAHPDQVAEGTKSMSETGVGTGLLVGDPNVSRGT